MGIGIGRMTAHAQAEEAGVKLAQTLGASSLAELRAKSAEDLLKNGRGPAGIIVDGWYVPEDLSATFAKGKENDVDVLVGSNRDEGTFFARGPGATAAQFESRAKQRFGDLADNFLKVYPVSTDAEAAAASLAGTRDEMGWHMRTWAQIQAKRGKINLYLYFFTRVPPTVEGRPSRGATHTVELSYVFDNLLPGTPWTDVDRKLADMMSSYWVNFAATGNPNGRDFPSGPRITQKPIKPWFSVTP